MNHFYFKFILISSLVFKFRMIKYTLINGNPLEISHCSVYLWPSAVIQKCQIPVTKLSWLTSHVELSMGCRANSSISCSLHVGVSIGGGGGNGQQCWQYCRNVGSYFD